MLEENHSRVQSRSLSNVSFFIHKVVRTPFYMCKYEGIYKIRLKETLNLHDKDFFRLRNKSIPAFTFRSECLWPNDKDMNNKHYGLWTQSYPRCELQWIYYEQQTKFWMNKQRKTENQNFGSTWNNQQCCTISLYTHHCHTRRGKLYALSLGSRPSAEKRRQFCNNLWLIK